MEGPTEQTRSSACEKGGEKRKDKRKDRHLSKKVFMRSTLDRCSMVTRNQ